MVDYQTNNASIKINNAYILAGGLSKRFNGSTKGLINLGNKPLIDHVMYRISQQTSIEPIKNIWINSHLSEFDAFQTDLAKNKTNYRRIDEPQAGEGPLNGVLACLQHFNALKLTERINDWFLICPCDAPFLPLDLTTVLSKAINEPHKVACIRYDNELQPVFSIWHSDLLASVNDAVTQKHWGGIKIFLKSIEDQLAIVDYPLKTENPFLNINTLNELQLAEELLP